MTSRTLKSILMATVAMSAASISAGFASAQSAATDEKVTVTGSRIKRRDFTAPSPVSTVSGEATTSVGDITLETYLNTLPQVAPNGTSTSNNPGNGGQSNIDLRGLGSNRNLILIDGRRPMVSSSAMTVDINTIPQALIQRVELVTGGAGAAYGADAVAGAVNFILKDNFEGADFRVTYQNQLELWDSKEVLYSGVIGANTDDGKGNAVIAFDRATREPITKGQRPFSRFATATTTTYPTGAMRTSLCTAGALATATDALFDSAAYGGPTGFSACSGGLIGFNTDGTLFNGGVFNNPRDARNFRYAVDSPAAPNINFFPDLYSYNFDEVNALVLPYEREAFMGKARYEVLPQLEVYGQFQYTNYTSATTLAPTPVGPVYRPVGTNTNPRQAVSPLIIGGTGTTGIPVPFNNPFIPADLAALLALRTADSANIAGAGPTEAFLITWRTLPVGARLTENENTVRQAVVGMRGEFGNGWEYDAYVSDGVTDIRRVSKGGVLTERIAQALNVTSLAAADAVCAGGINPFGVNPLSQECIDFIKIDAVSGQKLQSRIASGFVRGPVFELPAGDVEAVFGAEYREFLFLNDPGALNSPVAGPNTVAAGKGRNDFVDLFTEWNVPLVANASMMKALNLGLKYRYSESKFEDELKAISGAPKHDHAYAADLVWQVNDTLLFRGAYSHSVRAPNFGELFDGGSSFPQFFDPCAVGGDARAAGGAAFDALCIATGVPAAIYPTFVPSPAGQVFLSIAAPTNPNLIQSEVGDTYTVGMTLRSPFESEWLKNMNLSLDYYSIKLTNAIQGNPNEPNVLIADCFNYYGNNPALSALHPSCAAVTSARNPANGDMNGGQTLNPLDPVNGNYTLANGGFIKSAGIDMALDWAFSLESIGLGGASAGGISTRTLVTWNQTLELGTIAPAGLVQNFTGTIPYFGTGFSGQPEWKATVDVAYSISDWTFSTRSRFIGEMPTNFAAIQYPGETQFTGVDSVWYVDANIEWDMFEFFSIKAGVNNVFDKQPPQYTPNVQSGTSPSEYDVVGRRGFVQGKFKF